MSPRHAVGALPAFHTLGMLTQLMTPILNGGTACIYPPVSTATEYVVPPNPTSENALENAKRTNATGITAVPAMVLEWQSPQQIAYLKTLKLVVSKLIFQATSLAMRFPGILRGTARHSCRRLSVQRRCQYYSNLRCDRM